MIEKVLHYIQKYRMIEEGDTIVAGISGGADSVCLLFVLTEIRKRIPFRLAVVHVNHGIRAQAGSDAEYVRKLCMERGIPFYLTETDVKAYAKERGLSEEEAGREVRYQAFEAALLKECDNGKGKIAVAHNSNDCAETMLFHLFRGTGLKGLSGIKPINGNIIRPILCLERKEIEEWLIQNQIAYCHDHTNEEDAYTRNRIRHHILPYAEEEVCKGAVGHMNRAATYLQQAQEYAERQTNFAKMRCCTCDSEEITIRILDFEKEDEYIQGQLLLSCLEEISPGRKDITSVHVNQICELMKKDGSKEIHLPYGILVCKAYDRVTIKREEAAFDNRNVQEEKEEYLIEGNGSIEIPGLGIVEFMVFPYRKNENIPQKTYTKWFDYGKINQSVLFRKRRSGDYLTINSQMSRKSLQDYFVNEKIPKAKRDFMYVLADASHIMWVPGHRISENYKVTEETEKILQVTIRQNFT